MHDLVKSTKTTGPEGISPKLIHEAGAAIVPSLIQVINLSLSNCKMPTCWKLANVIPLFNKGKMTIRIIITPRLDLEANCNS